MSKLNSHSFDRMELSGSLGDLGTIIPLCMAMIMVNHLSFTPVFAFIGLFYLGTGLYYHLPLPVQPLKVVSAIAIAYPHQISLEMISASALVFAGLLALLASTGLIERLAGIFSKPVVRGIQLGLGLMLLVKGLGFVMAEDFLIGPNKTAISVWGVSLNLIVGILAGFLALCLLNSRKAPAALVIVVLGALAGVFFGGFSDQQFSIGPSNIKLIIPQWPDFYQAFWLLVLPQIPLTIGNAVISTKQTALSLFSDKNATKRVTNRALCFSMSIANFFVGLFAAMPLCHGAGGLAAHYRFGARTGGSNLIIGGIFLVIALVFGKVGLAVLGVIPQAVLGVLLIFAGLELGLLIKDLQTRTELFICLLIAGLALATKDMSIAFLIGLLAQGLIKKLNLEI